MRTASDNVFLHNICIMGAGMHIQPPLLPHAETGVPQTTLKPTMGVVTRCETLPQDSSMQPCYQCSKTQWLGQLILSPMHL
jgi:hypothetical protein